VQLLVDVQAVFDVLLFVLTFDERVLVEGSLADGWDFVAGWVL
jgi:hypothetical protein